MTISRCLYYDILGVLLVHDQASSSDRMSVVLGRLSVVLGWFPKLPVVVSTLSVVLGWLPKLPVVLGSLSWFSVGSLSFQCFLEGYQWLSFGFLKSPVVLDRLSVVFSWFPEVTSGSWQVISRSWLVPYVTSDSRQFISVFHLVP